MCFTKMIERFKKMPNSNIIATVCSKTLGGVAIGLLIAHYYGTFDIKLVGWGLFAIAFIIGLPSAIKILRK